MTVSRTIFALFCAVLIASTGCLSRAHKIPRAELVQLAQTDPHTRGQSVRVVQSFGFSEQPPYAEPVGSNTNIIIAPGHIGGGSGFGVQGFVYGDMVAEASKQEAEVWLVIAGITALAFATTEGARYDGWARLHPMHPVHLRGYNGRYSWVPLAQLTEQMALSSESAWVRRDEGPWQYLDRAPLDRVGFTYSLLLGSKEITAVDGSSDFGFSSHIQLGYFPSQQFGFVFDTGLAWRDNQFGNTIFEQRYAVELQVLPWSSGKLHAGFYGQAGVGVRLEDPNDTDYGTIYGGGGLLQIELTTRLTLTGRAGISVFDGDRTTDFTAGISIY